MKQTKILPALVCGFGAAVITTFPGLKGPVTCCLFVPLAAVLSLIVHQKMNQAEAPFKTGTAIFFGFFTGLFIALFSTFFDTIITLITHTNEFVESLPQTESMMKELNFGQIYKEVVGVLKSMANEIRNTGFSFMYTLIMFFSNIVIDSVSGIIGGLLGLLIVNRNTKQK